MHNPFTSGTATALTDIVAHLMDADTDDDSTWTNRFAVCIEAAANQDDLALLRNAKLSDEILDDFYRTVQGDSWFGCADLIPYEKGECYRFALSLAKLDRDFRNVFLRQWATQLRTRPCKN